MNFELTDERVFLRDAARGALARRHTVEAAHALLEGEDGPDLWPVAREAGWPGLLIGEEHGGAGLGALDAMLVSAETGRVLAAVPLLGHVPATAILAASSGHDDLKRRLADGDARAAWLPAAPPTDLHDAWTAAPESGHAPAPAPTAALEGEQATVSGNVHWVPDAAGADVLVVVATAPDGTAIGILVDPDADGVEVEETAAYDATRPLAHVRLHGVRGQALSAPESEVRAAWHLAQGLLAAEALGAVEAALEMAVAYAKERHTFGRPIGSYQAVKHNLVEILRLMENARALVYYAGWARQDAPAEFPLAAAAARVAAGKAFDHASREMISVHGGIGATWEHDAPLYFRRAQLSRRLLGGTDAATDRVAEELLAEARAGKVAA